MRPIILLLALLVASPVHAAATIVQCKTAGGSQAPCPQPLGVAYIPTAIPAPSIGGGAISNAEFSYLDGSTGPLQAQIDALQPLSVNLTAFLALNSTGFPARTGTNTWAQRSIAAGSGITVTNGDGVSGNPSIALTDLSITLASGTGLSVAGCSPVSLGGTCTVSLGTELAGVVALASTGIVTRTASGTYAARTITAGAGIGVTNGDGVAAAPSIAIDATVATLTGAQILTNKTLNCGNNTCTVRLASDVTGILPVANGGTNSATGSLAGMNSLPDSALSSLVLTTTNTKTITNKSFDATAGTNTLTNVANASLVNPSLTIAAGTGLSVSGCSPVALGSTCTPSVDTAVISTVANAAAQKTGGILTVAIFVGSLSAGDYAGIGMMGEGSSATATSVTPLVLPVAGTLQKCAYAAKNAASSTTNLTIHKASTSNTPTYATSSIVIPVTSGDKKGNDTMHTYVGAQFDTLIVQTSAALSSTSGTIVCQFIPST